MVNVVIDEHIFIDPDEAAMSKEEIEPNELVHYDVNLLKQTHVLMRTFATLWNRMQTRHFGVGEVSRTVGGREWCENGSRRVHPSACAFCGR